MSELCRCRARWEGRIERRAQPRRVPLPTISCGIKVRTNELLSPARILNVSAGGIHLSTSRKLQPGDPALIELANPSTGFSRLKLTRICHAFESPSGEFLAGGQFANPLSAEEVEALLGV
jgi:PilZ domain